ncbi:hypothetical protein VBY75_11850 [Idiomarina sp. HB]
MRLIRLPQVKEMNGLFRASAWIEGEVVAWIEGQVADRDGHFENEPQ